MDLDLGKALQDAARSGTAHRTPLRPAPVLQRIRRRRTVRVVGESTVGVAAAGAVAFGAVHVVDGRALQPAPPALGTPTVTPEPDLPVATPTGDFVCGQPVPAIDDPTGDADLHLEPEVAVLTPEGTGDDAGPADPAAVLSVGPGEQLGVDAVLVNGAPVDLDASAPDGGAASIWFVQDGTVVGTWAATAPDRPAQALVGGTGTRWSQPQGGAPTACTAPEESGGSAPPSSALPAGTYDLYVTQTLRLSDGQTLGVAGGPVTVAFAGPAEDPGVAPDAGAEPDPGTDAAQGHPDLEDLVVSPSGLGPLAVGRPPAGNPGAAMITFDPGYCQLEYYDGDPGRWVAAGYDDVVLEGGSPRAPFSVDADDRAVLRIDVVVPEVRTAEGVGIGTTVEDLRATYPQLEGPYEGGVSRVWWLRGPSGTLVFETQGDENGLQPAGTPEQVILVRVLDSGIDPAFATANTDHVAGGCL